VLAVLRPRPELTRERALSLWFAGLDTGDGDDRPVDRDVVTARRVVGPVHRTQVACVSVAAAGSVECLVPHLDPGRAGGEAATGADVVAARHGQQLTASCSVSTRPERM
jgi:hypothetical protein